MLIFRIHTHTHAHTPLSKSEKQLSEQDDVKCASPSSLKGYRHRGPPWRSGGPPRCAPSSAPWALSLSSTERLIYLAQMRKTGGLLPKEKSKETRFLLCDRYILLKFRGNANTGGDELQKRQDLCLLNRSHFLILWHTRSAQVLY